MAGTPAGNQDDIEAALRAIVAEHGAAALSNRATMSNLLKDLLPDSPQVARMFVAAAEDRIAEELLARVAQGLDGGTAARLAASLFAGATMYSPESCLWVTGEIAVALGLLTRPPSPSAEIPPTQPEPDGVAGAAGGAAHGGAEPITNRVARTSRLSVPPPSSAVIAAPDAPVEFPPDADQPAGPGPDDEQSATPERDHSPVGSPASSARRRLSKRGWWIGAASTLAAAAVAVVLVVLLSGSSPAIGYVISSNGGITPVNFSTGQVGQTVAVGRAANAIAITPDGQTAYVTNPDGAVTQVSLGAGGTGAGGTGTGGFGAAIPGQPIRLTFDPAAIAITPDGRTAYVTGGGTVTPVDVATGIAGTSVNLGDYSASIAIAPDGKTGYVTSMNVAGQGTVIPLDLGTGQPGPAITAGAYGSVIVIAPNGKTAYVTDDADGSVVPIDLATGHPRPAINLGSAPDGLVLAPDGTIAYALTRDTIFPIALPGGPPLPPIRLRLPAGIIATSITIAADGKTAYIAAGHAVIPVNLATGQLGHPIKVSKDATVTAVAP